MPKSINLTGTAGKTYDLEKLANSNTRGDSSKGLVVQVWYWSPELPATNPHKLPNPPGPLALGQMWMSRLVEVDSPEYNEIKGVTRED